MNSKCYEWGLMKALITKEHPKAKVEDNFAVRKHGTGYLVTYSTPLPSGTLEARAAFCHLDGMVWDRPCSFPDPGAETRSDPGHGAW